MSLINKVAKFIKENKYFTIFTLINLFGGLLYLINVISSNAYQYLFYGSAFIICVIYTIKLYRSEEKISSLVIGLVAISFLIELIII
ncbi:hypothetical protein [Anaerorhabdus furcosa]|uniref:Uncharacterized protein n=1 Tax=Anaerorhabdus furcosa TaxID=118967 RepID=A0A1T4PKG3_9FIRM|nr:hypothetical protein [Anaerorhabdus furcosa]SJZ91992.1 hypothetical protein SAMN02745191_2083 [Anaerorhabdus furcosa]